MSLTYRLDVTANRALGSDQNRQFPSCNCPILAVENREQLVAHVLLIGGVMGDLMHSLASAGQVESAKSLA